MGIEAELMGGHLAEEIARKILKTNSWGESTVLLRSITLFCAEPLMF